MIDDIENLALDRATELFGAEHANVQPHAGAQTNMAVYSAVLDPGDTILSLELQHGGHLTHGLKVNFSGKLYSIVHYGVSRETMIVDYDEVSRSRRARPKLIVCGGSAYPRMVETDKFREIADEVGALLLCDMAHFAGLVAAGLHPNPVRHCDFVTSTTHKTLAGPRSGFILCKEEHGLAVDKAVFPGMQGGRSMPHRRGQGDVLQDRRHARLPRIPGAGADERGRPGRDAAGRRARRSDRRHGHASAPASTSVRPIGAARRPRSGCTRSRSPSTGTRFRSTSGRRCSPSGIRIGTPAVTMRGFDEDDCREVGEVIVGALAEGADLGALRAQSEELCRKRPLYPGFRGFPTYVA